MKKFWIKKKIEEKEEKMESEYGYVYNTSVAKAIDKLCEIRAQTGDNDEIRKEVDKKILDLVPTLTSFVAADLPAKAKNELSLMRIMQ